MKRSRFSLSSIRRRHFVQRSHMRTPCWQSAALRLRFRRSRRRHQNRCRRHCHLPFCFDSDLWVRRQPAPPLCCSATDRCWFYVASREIKILQAAAARLECKILIAAQRASQWKSQSRHRAPMATAASDCGDSSGGVSGSPASCATNCWPNCDQTQHGQLNESIIALELDAFIALHRNDWKQQILKLLQLFR